MPDAPEPRRQIRWLHLSDLHFRAGETWDTRATLKALLQHQREEKEAGRGPDFVFVTGDVAFSGKADEYEQAEFFFRQLAKDLGLEPHEHFFFVPGNHDVDRREIGPSRFIAQSLNPDVLEEVMADAGTMDRLGRRLETFYAFTHRLQGPARALHSSRPWRVDVREVGGARLGVLQLNSAWVSGPDDEKDRLVLGTPQLRTALEEAADAFVRVALVHHPTADLRVWDKAPVEELLGAPGGVHFLLYGHRHRTGTFVQSSPDGHVVHLAAGDAFDDKPWPRSFLSAQLDLDAGRAEVRYFHYSDRGRGFWIANTGAYEAAKADGIWRFDLAPSLSFNDTLVPTQTRHVTYLRLDDSLAPIQTRREIYLAEALELWREKLAFLLREEALAVDAGSKFSIRVQIDEAKSKIREIKEIEVGEKRLNPR